MFTGLSAFPLTPLADDRLDEGAFRRLVGRLAAAGVDSITALGSTGSYAYLSADERARAAAIAVDCAGDTPVFVGVGALRTSHVLNNIDAAQEAGAAGLLLAPMTYQPLCDDEVFELFRAVSEHTRLPVIVYDNPGTTHFVFSNELYGRIAQLPGIASIKIPGVPPGQQRALEHVRAIRSVLPEHVTIGVSGDADAARGMIAGCQAWYSVIGGTLPGPALRIARAALAGNARRAMGESDRLAPLWELFEEFGGSMRVVAAIAAELGLVAEQCLPLPLRPLSAAQRDRVRQVLHAID